MRFFAFLSVMAILISIAVLIIVMIKSKNENDALRGGESSDDDR